MVLMVMVKIFYLIHQSELIIFLNIATLLLILLSGRRWLFPTFIHDQIIYIVYLGDNGLLFDL